MEGGRRADGGILACQTGLISRRPSAPLINGCHVTSGRAVSPPAVLSRDAVEYARRHANGSYDRHELRSHDLLLYPVIDVDSGHVMRRAAQYAL